MLGDEPDKFYVVLEGSVMVYKPRNRDELTKENMAFRKFLKYEKAIPRKLSKKAKKRGYYIMSEIWERRAESLTEEELELASHWEYCK